MPIIKHWTGSEWIEVGGQSPPPTIDNDPVENKIDAAISSSWAHSHQIATDPHTGYVLGNNVKTVSSGTVAPENPAVGDVWIDQTNSGGVIFLSTTDIHSVPISGATTSPVSSSWAYTHTNDTTIHKTIGPGADQVVAGNDSRLVSAEFLEALFLGAL